MWERSDTVGACCGKMDAIREVTELAYLRRSGIPVAELCSGESCCPLTLGVDEGVRGRDMEGLEEDAICARGISTDWVNDDGGVMRSEVGSWEWAWKDWVEGWSIEDI